MLIILDQIKSWIVQVMQNLWRHVSDATKRNAQAARTHAQAKGVRRLSLRRINNMLLKNCMMEDSRPGICYCAPMCKHIVKADEEHFVIPVCIYMGDSDKDDDIQEDDNTFEVFLCGECLKKIL